MCFYDDLSLKALWRLHGSQLLSVYDLARLRLNKGIRHIHNDGRCTNTLDLSDDLSDNLSVQKRARGVVDKDDVGVHRVQEVVHTRLPRFTASYELDPVP